MSFQAFCDYTWERLGKKNIEPDAVLKEKLGIAAGRVYAVLNQRIAAREEVRSQMKAYWRLAKTFNPSITRDEFQRNCEASRGDCEYTETTMKWGPVNVVCEGYDLGQAVLVGRPAEERPHYLRVEGNTRKHPHEFPPTFCLGPASRNAMKQAFSFGMLESARAVYERQIQFRETHSESYTPALFYNCPACKTIVNEEREPHPIHTATPQTCGECGRRTCSACTYEQSPCRTCRNARCKVCKRPKPTDGHPCRCDPTLALILANGAFAAWPGDEIFKNALATVLRPDLTPAERFDVVQGLVKHWEHTYGEDIATLYKRGVAALEGTVQAKPN